MTLVGSKILHYRILQEIGAGGMGIVYLAEDEKLHRRVALKFLAKSIQDDPAARDRLMREARAASALNHPNIVATHAIETADDRVFIVMEYVEGDSLHKLVKAGKITWQRALEIAPQILSALSTAHDAGIVHRDIKSDNILLTSKGQVKVLDFGLARGRDPSVFITRSGSSAGTPAYMSPEQVRDEPVDERSDLFSFGVVLYEMLTGRMPFKGEHEAALTYSIVNETPVDVRKHNPQVPATVQPVVSKLLEKDPKDRYASANAVLDDLHRVESGGRATSARRSRTALVAAAIAAVVTVAAVWTVRYRSANESSAAPGADPGRKMLVVLPFQNMGPTDQEYFADGITEEITTQLAKLADLGVISRTSAMKYKGTKKSVREIGKELGVDYALEGSVRWDKSGQQNNVRITTQLIRIDDDTHLWADNFDRVYEQIFSLQSEIAQRVATALDVTLLEPERAALAVKPTKNLDAYDSYLRGRSLYEQAHTPEDADAALATIEQAVAMDSTFARAQAYLARTYSNQYFNHLHHELPRVKQARTAALAAMRHTGNQPAGHVAMGYYYYYAERNFDRALTEFQSAAKLQPNDADVLEAIAYVQRRQSKWDESVENLERAMQIDPENISRIGNLVQTLMYMRRWADAEVWVKRGFEKDPGSLEITAYQAALKVQSEGDLKGAAALLEPLVNRFGPVANFRAEIAIMSRDYDKVHEILSSLRAIPYMDTTQYYQVRGAAYYFAGDQTRATTYFDSCRVFLEEKYAPKWREAEILAGYAAVLAALNRKEEALRSINRAVEMLPVEKDALTGSDIRNLRGIVYLTLEDYDAAIREIEYLLSVPSSLSPAILRLHPGFDPIRDDPRFKKLAEEKVSL
ncbi:MAG TPA: protein kinase [Candidatus Krumholzibacteria bacterium]|nr:protein kinase [Candidatus Krumholzibacteria bacterium]